ncbi:unnamed protein product, partial [Brassica rapa]
MWVKWFEYLTPTTMDEDLTEEACRLRRPSETVWPGSIEKEKQSMNVEKEEKKKKCKVKLNRMRSKNHRQKLRQFQTYASVYDDSSRLLWSSSSAKLLAFLSRSVLLVTC